MKFKIIENLDKLIAKIRAGEYKNFQKHEKQLLDMYYQEWLKENPKLQDYPNAFNKFLKSLGL